MLAAVALAPAAGATGVGSGVAGAARVTAAAPVATLALDRPCYDQSTPAHHTPLQITGTGFQPNENVQVRAGGLVLAVATADASGALSTAAFAPTLSTASSPAPLVRGFALGAFDAASGQSIAVAPASLMVATLGLSIAPATATPHQRVTFSATGLIPSGAHGTQILYAHYLFRHRTLVTERLGALDACGSLTAHRELLPTRTRRGRWTIQFDPARTYSSRTTPRITDTLTIS